MSATEQETVERQFGPITTVERQRDEDSDWALANYGELVKQYPGEYLVVWRKEVIDHGPDPEELLRRAATPERLRQELVVVAFPNPFAELPH